MPNNLKILQASAKTASLGSHNIMLKQLRHVRREEVVNGTFRKTTLSNIYSSLLAGPALMGKEEHQAAPVT